MIDLSTVDHHPALEAMVDVMCNKTQNLDRGFFRAEAAYFFAKMASSMRASIITKDRGEIPVNLYVLALATSGFGKGHSVHIAEDLFLGGFKKRFTEDTMAVIAEQKIWDIANTRAARNGTDQNEEYEKTQKEYRQSGAFTFTFDSGTPPAVKQLRHKLLMSGCGSINLQIDEIGSNLLGVADVLTLFLELYDQGMVKQKLTKNTADNVRNEELEGKTPTNMLLFGTPSKLLNGSQTEEQFYDFLETGYARRCIFGFGQHKRASASLTPAEVYHLLTQPTNDQVIQKWSTHFHNLADAAMFGWKMVAEDDVGIQLLTYKIYCENEAEKLPEHEDIKKAEISHRYFKALKLAGAYAFVDMSTNIEMDHLLSAIKLVEESGDAFQKILNREKSYVKLAKYIASEDHEVTHADLHEKLPFYKASQTARNETMTLATAWGYRHHIIIKKSFRDGIEFFKGETLQETDISKLKISYSTHWAYNYLSEEQPFNHLHVLAQASDEKGGPIHWTNHQFKNGAKGEGHRAEENVIAGFNLVVIDVDGGVSMKQVHELLKDYKFLTYTTKRHTETENRFRLIFPINYTLELNSDEYKEFMNSIMEWLPFKSDEGANQRARKWESFPGGTHHYNDGVLLDALDHIPKTSRNEQHRSQSKQLQSLDNLERWFAQRIVNGNRSNQMIKFALAIADSGTDHVTARNQVIEFNRKLPDPIDQSELERTILVTLAKHYRKT